MTQMVVNNTMKHATKWLSTTRWAMPSRLCWLQVLFSDADAMADASKGRISTWIQAQHQAECASVAALYQVAATAAERGICLPTTLWLRVVTSHCCLSILFGHHRMHTLK
jgi:hypothetical protein